MVGIFFYLGFTARQDLFNILSRVNRKVGRKPPDHPQAELDPS